MMIDKGTMIKIMENIYIDFPGGAWKDHFVMRPRRLIAQDIPNNKGYFPAKDSSGRIHYFVNINDVMEVRS